MVVGYQKITMGNLQIMKLLMTVCQRVSAACVCALFISCAHQPKTLYQWGSYETQVYQHFKGEGPSKQIQELEKDLQKTQATHQKVPPGFLAYLGFLYAEAGDETKARDNMMAEKAQYPEASPYIVLLLKQNHP